MKKFFAAVILMIVFTCANTKSDAQIVSLPTLSKTSLSGTDTATCPLPLTSESVSIEFTGLKTSGTVAGKIYFIATYPDGVTTTKLDSLAITNVSTLQTKVIAITTLPYKAYSLQFLSTGGVWVPKAYICRRTAGN